ncbi:MAG: metallophosphatase domain-containing protein [Deltaproteobacteria bacterium]|nr:metallophosphatase domain-containing protein [Deltaproteobacteria bacterium]
MAPARSSASPPSPAAVPAEASTVATQLTIVALADTHGCHRSLALPPGDVLIHAGDLTDGSGFDGLADICDFLRRQPHRHKIAIAGNHDFCLQDEPERALGFFTGIHYLLDQQIVIEGIKFYGSPWQPRFADFAFNLDRGPPLAERWAQIPDDTEILVTHCPPHGIGDRTHSGRHAGCEDLLARVRQVRPALHLFGHIHEGNGRWQIDDTLFANVTTGVGRLPATVLQYTPRLRS